MTSPDDGPRDDPASGQSDPHVEPQPPLDEEAAWLAIVANYGERPEMGDSPTTPDLPEPAPERADPAPLVDRSYLDAIEAAPAPDRHDDEHFVPPDPPPVPRGTPARRLAWVGLFGAPLVMLAAVVFGWALPTWFSMLLVGAFVGGFVFLVATMPRNGGDGWGDGAVV
jgi:hypothetical protein